MDYSDEEMRLVRFKEQRKAAIVGEYAAQVMLDFPSKVIKDVSRQQPVEDILQPREWTIQMLGPQLDGMGYYLYNIGKYYRCTGDKTFIREEWPFIVKVAGSLAADDYCISEVGKQGDYTDQDLRFRKYNPQTGLIVDNCCEDGVLREMTLTNALAASGLRQAYALSNVISEPVPLWKQRADGLDGYHHLLEYGYLASQKDPFDPIEKEIKNTTEKFLKKTEHIHDHWKLVREYPLTKHLLALSHVWQSLDRRKHVLAAKGAPEAIADLCHFTDEQTTELLTHVKEMTDKGLRVLGVARSSFKEDFLPDKQHDFEFIFIGLLGFVDPVRSTVAPSLKECYTAGMRMIMITGDYPGTAQHIARQIGMKNPPPILPLRYRLGGR